MVKVACVVKLGIERMQAMVYQASHASSVP